MPARQPQTSFDDRVLSSLESLTDDLLDRLVAEQGPPPDAPKLSEAEEDTAWETMDPLVDDEEMSTLLMTQGLPPELVQQLLVIQANKGDQERQQEWIAALTQPTQDAELANTLVKMVKWPFRAPLLEQYDDPEEQVEAAEKYDRRYQKRMTAMQENVAMPGMVRTTSGYQGMAGQ